MSILSLKHFQLTKWAQAHSEKMIAEGTYEHSLISKEYGENIWRHRVSFLPNATEELLTAVDLFYEEVKNYGSFSDRTGLTGHFTQVVWKETKSLGMGIAVGGEEQCDIRYKELRITANYNPPGNYNSKQAHEENVQARPSKTEAECSVSRSNHDCQATLSYCITIILSFIYTR